jgi:hypothetical protein
LILCARHLSRAGYNSILDQYLVIFPLIADALLAMSDDATNRPTGSALTREDLLNALRALSDKLGEQGVTGELCLFGGTVMVLAFSARLATKDIDALFKPPNTIRELAGRIATELRLPNDWLNDGVKGFLSARHETTAGNLPQFPHLRLTMPVPEYLLAMKCMASRIGGTTGEQSDVSDIMFLIRHLGLKSARDVLDIVAQYYPANQIPVKTQYLIEGLFEEGVI